MRRLIFGSMLVLVAAALPAACGGLSDGEITIIDGAGSPGTGGSGGSGGSVTNGGRGGKLGSGGRAGATGGTGTGGTVTGGSAGDATTGASGADNAGAGTGSGGSSSGGTAGTGGTMGSAGAMSGACSGDTDCGGTTPICDAGECRGCKKGSTECAASYPTAPYCQAMTGRCVECLGDTNCTATTPVCDAGTCRKCNDGSECASGACTAKGRCADESNIVYALAVNGSTDSTTCGTKLNPCRFLPAAVAQLNSGRPILVLQATNLSFEGGGGALPAGVDVNVVGNHVNIATTDQPAFKITGGNVLLDDVVVTASRSSATGTLAAISCTGNASLGMIHGIITLADDNYSSYGVSITDCNATFSQVTFLSNHTALSSQSSLPTPAQALTVERCVFDGNTQAIDFNGDHFTIRNNLFVKNGQTSYVRIVKPIGQSPSVFSYNTLYGNDNNCSYEGGLVACEGGASKCGIQSSNLFWGNMYGGTSMMPCYDQVYETPPPITNSITETTWPGTFNSTADPRLKDPEKGDFTPGTGSYAIDHGDTTIDVPAVDFLGNPRDPSAPDIGAIEVQ